VSHHIEKKFLEWKILLQSDLKHHFLEKELKKCNQELQYLSSLMKGGEIYVVHSNHHEFMYRYLNEARFMKDPPNVRIALRLASYMVEKEYNNPMEAGIRMMGKLPGNIFFLRPDDDLKVRGYQLASHGDRAPFGGRGSVAVKENDFGKSITGHCHMAQILRNTYTVGTTALPLAPYYMRGFPTASSHAHAMLWDTGTVQLVNVINGKYRAD
jgi:hypothetical protein